MSENNLKFAVFNGTLIHISDSRVASDISCKCIKCNQELSFNAQNKTFEHTHTAACTLTNADILKTIAKKQLAQQKSLCIPTQYINNEYRHELSFDKVLLDQNIDGNFIDALGFIGDTRVFIMFNTSLNVNEYVLDIQLPTTDWNLDNYLDTLQRLSDFTLGEEGIEYKKWTHMPFELMHDFGYFNTVKNGINLDAIKVDEYVFNIEELSTLQRGTASASAQEWFWNKASVWRNGTNCAWQGILYAHKCRKCEKLGVTGCSLVYAVPVGIGVTPPKSVVDTSVETTTVEYKEDLEF